MSKSAYLAAYDVHGKRQPNKQTVSDREQAGLEQDSISTFTTKIKLPHYDESIDWADPARGELNPHFAKRSGRVGHIFGTPRTDPRGFDLVSRRGFHRQSCDHSRRSIGRVRMEGCVLVTLGHQSAWRVGSSHWTIWATERAG